MKSRVYVLSLISLAMATWLLYHLISIWIYGSFFIHESNPFILALETALIAFSFVYSVSCAVTQLVNNSQSEPGAEMEQEKAPFKDRFYASTATDTDSPYNSELSAERESVLP